jgi:hypothetical protein
MFTLNNNMNDPYQVLCSSFQLYLHCFIKVFPLAFLAAFFSFLPSFHFLANKNLQLALLGACLLISFFFLTAMIFRIYCLAYQIPHHFLDGLKQGALKFLPLLLLCVLYAIIVLGGTMLLIIPGIILAVSLMFCFMLLITDNHSLLQSLISSHRLIWGQWWMTLTVMSFPLLLNLLIALAGLIGLFALFMLFDLPVRNFNLLATGLGLIIQSLFLPLIFSTALMLVFFLKTRLRGTYVE